MSFDQSSKALNLNAMKLQELAGTKLCHYFVYNTSTQITMIFQFSLLTKTKSA